MSNWTWHNSWYIKLKIWRDLNNVLTKSQNLKANSDLIFNSAFDSSLWFNFYMSIYHDNENDVLSVYEENFDCHEVNRVVLQENCFKIWDFK